MYLKSHIAGFYFLFYCCLELKAASYNEKFSQKNPIVFWRMIVQNLNPNLFPKFPLLHPVGWQLRQSPLGKGVDPFDHNTFTQGKVRNVPLPRGDFSSCPGPIGCSGGHWAFRIEPNNSLLEFPAWLLHGVNSSLQFWEIFIGNIPPKEISSINMNIFWFT